jgi:hypothetical protein
MSPHVAEGGGMNVGDTKSWKLTIVMGDTPRLRVPSQKCSSVWHRAAARTSTNTCPGPCRGKVSNSISCMKSEQVSMVSRLQERAWAPHYSEKTPGSAPGTEQPAFFPCQTVPVPPDSAGVHDDDSGDVNTRFFFFHPSKNPPKLLP